MIMDPREFYILASRLSAGPGPAEFRSAVSRAYYAAFHIGSQLLDALGFKVSAGSGGHGEVRNHLHNCGDPEVMAAISKLGGLHSKRIRADYHFDKTDVENPKTVEGLIKDAGNIIRALDECFVEPKKTQVTKSMREWAEKIRQAGN